MRAGPRSYAKVLAAPKAGWFATLVGFGPAKWMQEFVEDVCREKDSPVSFQIQAETPNSLPQAMVNATILWEQVLPSVSR